MILATSILFLALFSPVELFKFHQKASEESYAPSAASYQAQRHYQPPLFLGAPRYYPLPADLFQAPFQQAQLQQQFEQQQQQLPIDEPQLQQSTKGGEFKATKGLEQRAQLNQAAYLRQMPYVQPQPASIAYLVVRPLQSSPLLPAMAPMAQAQMPAGQLLETPYKQEELAGIKGGRQGQQIEQQHEIVEQQQSPMQPALVVPVPAGKEGKFKALLDRLMSKLTLGSSYQVTHEEIVGQPDQRQPALQQQPIQQQPIEQQQKKVEQIEEQRLEQQRDNSFDDGLKQTKGHPEQQQQQQQIREEQLQQNLADQELEKQREQQQAFKGQQQLLQEPIRQEALEPVRQEPIKGKRLLPDRLAGHQQIQQQQLQQEPLRQEAKGNLGF